MKHIMISKNSTQL